MTKKQVAKYDTTFGPDPFAINFPICASNVKPQLMMESQSLKGAAGGEREICVKKRSVPRKLLGNITF